jgi:hypothetical protein
MLAPNPLPAQGSGYHVELSDERSGHREIILVNDSDKPIEAFHLVNRCASGGSSAQMDTLGSPYAVLSIDEPDGRRTHRAAVEPGERWDTQSGTATLATKNGIQECDTEVDAVLFGDGSHAGRDDVARSMKAKRDGIVASVNYWADRIGRENPDGSGLATLRNDAERLAVADDAEKRMYPFNSLGDDAVRPLLYEYWLGRNQVDAYVALQVPKELNQDKAAVNLRKVVDFVAKWKNKIDSNLAMKNLNLEFPPVSVPAEGADPAADKP